MLFFEIKVKIPLGDINQNLIGAALEPEV